MLSWNNAKSKNMRILKENFVDIVIDNVNIFDGTEADIIENGRIYIKQGLLNAVGKKENVISPSNCRVIDGKGMTALPGLIDTHIHLSWNGVLDYYPIFFGEKLEDRLKRNAWNTLKSGVTTARDMYGFGVAKLKKAIEKGEVLGPRLQISTSALTVKNGYFDYPFLGIAIKNVKKVPMVIEKLVKKGSDFIKTEAPYSDALKKRNNISLDILSSIVREAKKSGLTVAVHTMWLEGLETAIDANVTSLEHCPVYVGGIMSDNIFIKAKEKGIFFVPTVDLLRRNYMIFNEPETLLKEKEYHKNMPPKSLQKMLKMAEKVKKAQTKKPEVKAAFDELFNNYKEIYSINFKKALESGIKIAAGTDSGANYTPHGILAKELEMYVKFGMTQKQAILSATKVGAELLGLEKEIGTLEPGKKADVILVNGNPLKNITYLQDIQIVIKEGVIVFNKSNMVCQNGT